MQGLVASVYSLGLLCRVAIKIITKPCSTLINASGSQTSAYLLASLSDTRGLVSLSTFYISLLRYSAYLTKFPKNSKWRRQDLAPRGVNVEGCAWHAKIAGLERQAATAADHAVLPAEYVVKSTIASTMGRTFTVLIVTWKHL